MHQGFSLGSDDVDVNKVNQTFKTPSDGDINDRSETLNFHSQEMITNSLLQLENSAVEQHIGDHHLSRIHHRREGSKDIAAMLDGPVVRVSVPNP